jgi:hypothetical protein
MQFVFDFMMKRSAPFTHCEKRRAHFPFTAFLRGVMVRIMAADRSNCQPAYVLTENTRTRTPRG